MTRLAWTCCHRGDLIGRYHSAGQMPLQEAVATGVQENGLAAKGAKSLEKHGSSKTCVTY